MKTGPAPQSGVGFQFHSSRLDEFNEVVCKRVRTCRFQGRNEPYDATLRQHHAGSVAFSAISLNPGLDVDVDEVGDSHLLQIALHGAFRARCQGTERIYGDGDVHVVNPAAPLRVFVTPGTTMLVVRVARSMLEEHARVLGDTGADLCVLPEALPNGSSEASSLRRYLEFLHAESMTPGSALHAGVTSRSAEQMLTSLMLGLAPRDEERVGADGRAVAGHVRRAEEYIDAHLDDDIGLVDIVASAGVDARTLDAGFRARRGTTPLSWLDQRRSECTARELGPSLPDDGAAASTAGGRPLLTARELEIARLVACGYNNREIADGLDVSRNTIKEALKRIFRKVDVDSRAELVLRLSEARLL